MSGAPTRAEVVAAARRSMDDIEADPDLGFLTIAVRQNGEMLKTTSDGSYTEPELWAMAVYVMAVIKRKIVDENHCTCSECDKRRLLLSEADVMLRRASGILQVSSGRTLQ